MTFILRWPSILVLLALVLLSFLGALGAAGLIAGYTPPLAQVQDVQAQAASTGASEAGWIDVAMLAGAGLFFLISAIRLMRRTQGFWTWLIGFALYGGRWAMAQHDGLVATVQGIDLNIYMQPQAVLADLGAPAAQVALLAIVFIVGLLILVIDGADRAYWDKQAA
jgi:hypothetical protein